MKMTMRWFGESDSVSLQNIAQVPVVRGIVGTIEDRTGDTVWAQADFEKLKQQAASHHLSLEVIESIPVSEEIKKGTEKRDALIEIFCENIQNMGKVGIPVLCYNFMPVFDWLRTDLKFTLADGSFVTSYVHADMLNYDLSKGFDARVAWLRGYTGDEVRAILDEYSHIDEGRLFENLAYFLKRIVPVAEKAGVFLALHPDDPPWPVFGLPRIVRDAASIQRILDVVDSPYHGLTFCTGSLGASPDNDLPVMVRQFAGRINFAHVRNIELIGDKSFIEIAHSDTQGAVNIPSVLQALLDIHYTGPLRCDHGRMIWGETGRVGYGLYDRALATMYLHGVWQGLAASKYGHQYL